MSNPAINPAEPPWRQGLRLGLTRGRGLLWFLLRTILPLYVITDIMKETGALAWISGFLSPVMGAFGLPSEAAAVITAGMLVNLYAATAVAAPLGLDWMQVSVLGLMLGICHSLPVEAAIVRQLSPGRGTALLLLRVGLGLVSGWALAQALAWWAS